MLSRLDDIIAPEESMQPPRTNKSLVFLFVLLTGLAFLALTNKAHSVSAQDTVPTNTPDSLGKIYYKVQAGDNCDGIAK